jgi:crotonobetainyl-CoA:carnitine CoA-transferase CaiB-like acyl-CoA transferase
MFVEPAFGSRTAPFGAEVIKVERPREGGDTRAFAAPFQGDQAAYFSP